tara:strand:+ start:337 stop:714 length:378 start_codon:yes stop_codon:yes gene_type:complete
MVFSGGYQRMKVLLTLGLFSLALGCEVSTSSRNPGPATSDGAAISSPPSSSDQAPNNQNENILALGQEIFESCGCHQPNVTTDPSISNKTRQSIAAAMAGNHFGNELNTDEQEQVTSYIYDELGI